jgi:predicted adenylyl cyclase CyaB
MEKPRRNIELKALDPEPLASLERCHALGAKRGGEKWQRDTHFEVKRGGLKLREEDPGRPHLIQFERAGQAHERESRYRILDVQDAAALSASLAAAVGIRAVVVKRRLVVLWRGVRIHLDDVEGLGTFIELEAVAPPHSDLARERELVAFLRTALAITSDRVISRGYAEQLLSSSAVAPNAPAR